MDKMDATVLERVVMAGMKLMYDKATRQFFVNGMKQEGPIADRLAMEAAGLIKMLDEKTHGAIPKAVIVPAAVALMMEMVRFMLESGIAKPKGTEIKEAMQKLVLIIMDQYGVIRQIQESRNPKPPIPAAVPAGGAPMTQAAPSQPATAPQPAPSPAGGLISAPQGA